MSDDNRSITGAEAMVRMLEAHGVEHIFGLCGDTTLPFYDAMYRLDHNIQHILTRDERHAAYMADAYARLTGKVGVCEGPSGGGATYILPGIAEANDSSIPVLAITSDVSTSARGRFPLTELDQKALFSPITKSSDMLDDAARLPAQVRAAFRSMTSSTPGTAHLGFPFDTQKASVNPDNIYADEDLGSFPSTRSQADPKLVEAAIDLLLASNNGIIICGSGVMHAGAEEELEKLARSLNIPIATTVSGQGVIAETNPLALGVVGSNGGVAETRQQVDQADIVFYIGCRVGSVTSERWRSPGPGTTIIHLDSNPAVLGVNYPTAVAMAGDALLTLAEFNRVLSARDINTNHNGLDRVKKAVDSKFAAFDKIASSTEKPVRPETVIKALQNALDDDAIVCADPA
ncbi:MAG: thiamine pyrophosphate-binding protein, partial [Aestuariibacter sp.]|nr:thiamine pyrophosphate-binding protein [Aestuariibacter sp.]